MFFTQTRLLCLVKGPSRSIEHAKNAVLTSVRKDYETIISDDGTQDEYGVSWNSTIHHERIFYNAYFKFATLCRINGETPWGLLTEPERKHFANELKGAMKNINLQALDWADHRDRDVVNARKVRSAFAFLEEDIISEIPDLYNSVDWRIVKNEGIAAIDTRLTEPHFYRCAPKYIYNANAVNLRGVPYSHNWWNYGKWTFRDSKQKFGEKVVREPRTPIIPITEVKNRVYFMNKHINVNDVRLVSDQPDQYIYVVDEMFQRHMKLRNIRLHSISLFSVNPDYVYGKKGYLKTIRCYDTLVSFACDHPEGISPLVVRSAIQFMEEEIVPYVDGAEPLWQEFLTGSGMTRLSELLEAQQWEAPPRYLKFENIPPHHTWWPEANRKIPGDLVDISVAFQQKREKMLCYLQLLAETPEGCSDMVEKASKFHEHYFFYVLECREHKQDPTEMMSEECLKEFRVLFSRAVKTGNLFKFVPEYSNNLRYMCSSLEFLNEQENQNSEFMEFFKSNDVEKLNAILEESEHRYYSHYLDNVPSSHWWWTKK